MKTSKLFLTLLLAASFGAGQHASGRETIAEKAEIAGDRALDKTKKIYRSAKDKSCELVAGKMECQQKQFASRRKNITDKAKTEIKENRFQNN